MDKAVVGQRSFPAPSEMGRQNGLHYVDAFENERAWTRQLHDEHRLHPARNSLLWLVGF